MADIPAYIAKLPCVASAWADVTSVIDLARRRLTENSNTCLELEIRFGKKLPHSFEPGIPLDVFEALEKKFNSGRDWVRVDDWHNISVYSHPSVLPNDTRVLRTEVSYSTATKDPITIECIHKERICNHDYISLPSSASSTDLRLALNYEHKVWGSDIPNEVQASMAQIKMRKCFHYTPTGYNEPVWCYVFTKRWKGSTMFAAMLEKQKQPPICEIEIELSPKYLQSAHPSGYIAAKMLYKICDIMDMLHNSTTPYILEPVITNKL